MTERSTGEIAAVMTGHPCDPGAEFRLLTQFQTGRRERDEVKSELMRQLGAMGQGSSKIQGGAGVARKLASLCGLIVLIVVLAGCGEAGGGSTPGAANGSPAAAASARKPYAVGQAMKNDAHQSVTVSAFKRGVSTGNAFLTPAAGKECVQTDVALLNGDSTSWSLPLFEMAVVDANGQSYSESFICGGDSSTIQALIPNGKANASIRFEVPTGGALLFTWTPSALNPNSTYQTDLK